MLLSKSAPVVLTATVGPVTVPIVKMWKWRQSKRGDGEAFRRMVGDFEGGVKMPLRITAWEADECSHSLRWDPGRRRRLGCERRDSRKRFSVLFSKVRIYTKVWS